MIGRKEKKIESPHAGRRALIVLSIVIVASIGLRLYQEQDVAPSATALFVINSGSITAEIADTSAKRELGLGQREELAPRHGMYFPFPTTYKWVFWMKDMHFPIDAIWIKDGVVVDVTRNALPPIGEDIEKFSPTEPADAVLEINAGEADELNIRKGDRVRRHN